MTESGRSGATPEEAASEEAASEEAPTGEAAFGQATVHTFDASSGSGSVITDGGVVIPFSLEAWRSSRLLTLRVGQRLRVSVSGVGSSRQVTALTLATFTP